MEGDFEGIYYNDSDVYKVLEGIAYSLMTHPDDALQREADRIVDLISAAQQPDGYLMTYYTIKEKGARWTNMERHEMYCGGHLIEAAVAYHRATGQRKLLEVACRLADHYDSLFGPGKRHWVPGHQEIELALVKLYQETNEERYWILTQWLLEERGRGHGKGGIWERRDWGAAYCQDDKPVREQEHVSGHAVRAMYQYSAMADVAALTGDGAYLRALDKLWDSVVMRNMYVTGGIGPSAHNEGFTHDYDMPNDTAYCETCASIGMVLWNHRMNLLHRDAKFADVVERAMYNGILSGVSLSGDRFFYVNPLATDGSHNRVEWFGCSCCPTNIVRFVPSVGGYIYATADDGLYINQYISNQTSLSLHSGSIIGVNLQTRYPWAGEITITVALAQPREWKLRLRIPAWCAKFSATVNGIAIEAAQVEQGYLLLERTWQHGDQVVLRLEMPAVRVYAHPFIQADEGRVALQRGPLVYCVEEIDVTTPVATIVLPRTAELVSRWDDSLLSGVVVIESEALSLQTDNWTRGLYRTFAADKAPIVLRAVPYYAWNNRGESAMKVWLSESTSS